MKITLADKSIAWLTLFSGLSISAVAVWYSVAGLISIFAAAVVPIAVMGVTLELSKLVATVWLKQNWAIAPRLMRAYLLAAVSVLMLITSMGIFGYLSKAHLDQNISTGDVQAKISIYDEKIKTAKDNIDANRKALKQMDEAVDQIMGRSNDEKGADKAVQIRRSQQKERARLLSEIQAEQKTISQLSEERAPIAAEVRKVEAEVGPIKYIAALLYGDSPDQNLLEKAVRVVIILIVTIFDPLAVVLLLASQYSFQWFRKVEESNRGTATYEQDDGPLTNDQIEQIKETVKEDLPTGELITKTELFPDNPHPPGWMFTVVPRYPNNEQEFEELQQALADSKDQVIDESISDDDLKEAIRNWKAANPDDSLKHQRRLLQSGAISELPWEADLKKARMGQMIGHGTQLPTSAQKGDFFVKIDTQPTTLYKFNGSNWITVDKSLSDEYAYDSKYIEFLIESIGNRSYDPELLTDIEKEQMEFALNSTTTKS
jgi:hypothetical protein